MCPGPDACVVTLVVEVEVVSEWVVVVVEGSKEAKELTVQQ